MTRITGIAHSDGTASRQKQASCIARQERATSRQGQGGRDRESEWGRGVRVEGFREGDKKQGANESGFFASFPCILTLLPQMHLFSLITCGSYHIFFGGCIQIMGRKAYQKRVLLSRLCVYLRAWVFMRLFVCF